MLVDVDAIVNHGCLDAVAPEPSVVQNLAADRRSRQTCEHIFCTNQPRTVLGCQIRGSPIVCNVVYGSKSLPHAVHSEHRVVDPEQISISQTAIAQLARNSLDAATHARKNEVRRYYSN